MPSAIIVHELYCLLWLESFTREAELLLKLWKLDKLEAKQLTKIEILGLEKTEFVEKS